MSFQLRLKGGKELAEFVADQDQKRKSWNPRLRDFFKNDMKVLLNTLVKELKKETPYRTGTLQKRASFKFFKWNYFAFGYDENIEPTFNADYSYWKSGKTAKYWQYAVHRHKKNDFFLPEIWFRKITKVIDISIRNLWDAHFLKNR